ncbi:VOC family protein [Flaviaesturariibacter aridisoli]|uniref:VOC family protein n=1 Tax=Flaviaesturariibacter aridisoli TaxID=2545761 RepID=A0A4R4E3R5_9BACT|nr:VOC family protein [Flaviaesturariibacter aridisoli]TCZ74069.1 VOC family protein [Flaviaesturariibacter aridisoli]
MPDYISGIQQIGIGVADARTCLKEYARLFGMDTPVFDDVAEARLMTRYTGGQIYRRQALLSLNLEGGGGFEIWQFQNREPARPAEQPKYGDLGIYSAKIKCPDIRSAFSAFSGNAEITTPSLQTDPRGKEFFFVRDRHGNAFGIIGGITGSNKKLAARTA